MERSEDAAEAGMSNRWPEILVALFLFAIGIIVVNDSIRVGIGWEEGEGPRAGYSLSTSAASCSYRVAGSCSVR